MKVVKIQQTGKTGGTTYKAVCQFTEEDKLPPSHWELLDREFVIENMVSNAGFWFFVGPVLEQPPVEVQD
jgi:hypothetical protein